MRKPLTPQEDIENKRKVIIEVGGLFESLKQHPGWEIVQNWINANRKPERAVIREKDSPHVSLTTVAHISGQIDILDRLMAYVNGHIKQKNKIIEEEQNKKTSPK